MTAADRPAFAVVMGALFAAFGREEDAAILEGYWLGLEDVQIDGLRMAVRQAIKEERRLPVPATLREIAGAPARRAHFDEVTRACAAKAGQGDRFERTKDRCKPPSRICGEHMMMDR